ncbi:GGDEF domain-containing protein [Pseudoduganella namucuonensis]|uniref:diguanylate cyclase n=1 Tax=Pseudoduganella namucuonensis TaxID=1035707 RepID=A0A1I7JV99_9BURK|nr:GGDEF domain-containing protein [Pseudoduganella namucuonensis]SFU89132.1 diguanylate cyclase (GGDEF) domain-containing protein [Pseudoduganella namucuonensis]
MLNSLHAELASTRLFAGVSFDAIERLLEHCRVVEVPADTVLLDPAVPNEHLYVLLDGQVDVHLTTLSQPYYMRLGAGECVGEMSMIEARETSAYVMVSSRSRMLVLTRDTMWSLINASHALARNMLVTLSGRVRQGNDAVRDSIHRQSEFESLAFVDGLTGLHNRRWLDQAFRRQLERGLLDGKPLSILMIDIDHFKRFNDTHGHVSGDRSLRAVALALNDNLRPGDLLARYGGEEFAVLLPDTGAPQAVAIAERLRRAVAEPKAPLAADLPGLSISLGDTQMRPGDTLERMLERADTALYKAKSAGRNRVCSA